MTDPALIERAALVLRNGGLVGMPTETVYGIAADAMNEDAVLRTFAVKGRPSANPLIVHVPGLLEAERLASHFPDSARALAERFWPGPLTLVLRKDSTVPDVVTGGLDTVAVRVPDHEVALQLLRLTGMPVSAPSANQFMGLSPTRAEDIDPAIASQLDLILDGGPGVVGLESTVVDVSGEQARLLRPGGVSRSQIEDVLGVRLADAIAGERRSPGMYPRHYAPRTPVRIVRALGPADAGVTLSVAQSTAQRRLPAEPIAYGSALYAALHGLDAEGHVEILIESPPETAEWEAVWDRIKKAAG